MTGVDIDCDGRESPRTSSSTNGPDGVGYGVNREGGFHLLLSSVQIHIHPHIHNHTSITVGLRVHEHAHTHKRTHIRARAYTHTYIGVHRATNSNSGEGRSARGQVSQSRWRLRRTPRRFLVAFLDRRLPLYLYRPDVPPGVAPDLSLRGPFVDTTHGLPVLFETGVLRRSSQSCRLNACRRVSLSLFLLPIFRLFFSFFRPLVFPVPPATTCPAATGVLTRTTR